MSTQNEEISIDLTGADSVPVGECVLQIKKMEAKTSQAGNRMLAIQLTVAEHEDEAMVGRIVFDNWMLEGAALWKTKQALGAFLDEVPDGPLSIRPAEMIGLTSPALLVEDESDYGKRAAVKRYGEKRATR